MFDLNEDFYNQEFYWIEFENDSLFSAIEKLIHNQESVLKKQLEEYLERKEKDLALIPDEHKGSYEQSFYFYSDIEFRELTYMQRNSICLLLFSTIESRLRVLTRFICEKLDRENVEYWRKTLIRSWNFINEVIELKKDKELLEELFGLISSQIILRNAIAHNNGKITEEFVLVDGLIKDRDNRIFIDNIEYLNHLCNNTNMFLKTLIKSVDIELK